MDLKLTRPIVFFDVETTGLDVANDRIVTLGMVKLWPDGNYQSTEWMFNPGIPIPEHVVKIHGITNEMVRNSFPFAKHAYQMHDLFKGCDLGGFNLKNFDIPILWEELNRCGITWDLKGVAIVDAGDIFKKFEERTLEAAVRKYCGREHKMAHSAMVDAGACLDVLKGQIEVYGLANTVPELAKVGHEDFRVDLAGKIVLDRDGDPAYNFGKVRFDHGSRTGLKVKDEPGLACWALDKDFPAQTKLVLRSILQQLERAGQGNLF